LHFKRLGVGDVLATGAIFATIDFFHMPYHLQYDWDVVEL